MPGGSIRGTRIPLHERLREELRQQIAASRWKPGERIPPERALATTYGVSLITTRRALHDLTLEGVIVRRGPAGTFVAEPASRRHTIGIAAFDPDRVFARLYGYMLGGIQDAAQERATLQLLAAPQGVSKPAWLKALSREGGVAGLIVVSIDPVRHEDVAHLELTGFPYVLLNHRVPGHDVWCSVLNDFDLAQQAVTYLVELGHRHIAHLAGPPDFSAAADRLRGFLEGLRLHGLLDRAGGPEASAPDDAPMAYGVFGYGEEEEDESGYQGMRALLERRPRPTAVFAAADTLAAGAYRAIMEAGLRIPDDVSVIGVTNENFTVLLDPPLTTFDHRRREMGRQAVYSLIEQIEGYPEMGQGLQVRRNGRQRIVEARFLARRSCAPPRERKADTG